MKKITLIVFALIVILASFVSCGEPVTLKGATVDDGVLKFEWSDGTFTDVGSMPKNVERIELDGASLDENGLLVSFSDGYQKLFSNFLNYKDKIIGAEVTQEGTLLVKTEDGDFDLGKLLYPTVPSAPMTPSGASAYADTRDTTGRNTATVEMEVKGYGKVTILLDATTAPVTVKNFVNLVKSGFYDGLTFHRVIEDFMIQGGDPLGNGSGGSGTNIYGEFSSNGYTGNDILHKPGTISMARSSDKNSATSQFFICTSDFDSERGGDGNYAAFGYVLNGMNIVYKISELGSVYGDQNGRVKDYAKQIVITSIVVIEDLDVESDSGSEDENGENSGASGETPEGSGTEGSGSTGGNEGGSGTEGSGNTGGNEGSSGTEGSGSTGSNEDDTDDGGWALPG